MSYPSSFVSEHLVTNATVINATQCDIIIMQLIRCTVKLLKEVGIRPAELKCEKPQFTFLGQWHANLIYIDRRKCLLVVNDRTLFNFIVPDISRSLLHDLPNLFRNYLSCVLAAEGLSPEVKERILSEYQELEIGKSSSRSVLGSVNELTFHYKYSILKAGGVHSWQVPEIIRQMNRMPMKGLKFTFPIEELRDLYGITA